MAITDTDIALWNVTPNLNLPPDTVYIRQDLPRQWRNIKSVVRAESKAKQWLKTGLVTAEALAGDPSSIAFTPVTGDVRSMFPVARKVRLRPADGSAAFVYCGVISASYVPATTTTSVILADLVGVVSSTGIYSVDVGVASPTSSPFPLYSQTGTATIVDTNTDVVVTLPHKEPDRRYFVMTTLISTTSTVPGASIIAQITRFPTTIDFFLLAAPGTGKSTKLGWTILREMS